VTADSRTLQSVIFAISSEPGGGVVFFGIHTSLRPQSVFINHSKRL
jgi:hypothetical protein